MKIHIEPNKGSEKDKYYQEAKLFIKNIDIDKIEMDIHKNGKQPDIKCYADCLPFAIGEENKPSEKRNNPKGK